MGRFGSIMNDRRPIAIVIGAGSDTVLPRAAFRVDRRDRDAAAWTTR
jgi:hypothetical protein